MRNILVVFVLVCMASHFASSEKIVGCYWRADIIGLDQTDVSLCTHVYIPSYTPESGGIRVNGDSYDYEQILALKRQNPSVKFIVSAEDSEPSFSYAVNSKEWISAFVGAAYYILVSSEFDGIDVNWRYPKGYARNDFVNLLAELKKEINSIGKIVTAVISNDPSQEQDAYDYAGICQNVDFLNVKIFGQASYEPLESSLTTSRVDSPYNATEQFFQTLIDNGCSPEKLVLGPASSGCKYENQDPSNCYMGAPASRVGDLSYREICQTISYTDWVTLSYDGTIYAYPYSGKVSITYEDPSSVRQKGDIVKAKGLAGMFFFEADRDDYDGSCGGGKFPLILAARKSLGLDFSCTIAAGYLRHPKDCTKYYFCNYGQQTENKCPGFLSFRQSMNACVPLFTNPDCFSSSLADFIRVVFGV